MNRPTMTMPMQQGFPGTPMISGTWVNLNTKDWFIVRDQFFGEDGPVVMTADGRQINGQSLSEYLQISNNNLPENEIKAYINEYTEAQNESLGNPNADYNHLTAGLTQSISQPSQPTATISDTQAATSSNHDIIDKAFNGKVDAPEVRLHWTNVPTKQLELLKEVMDIPMEDIAEYIYVKYLTDKDTMIGKVKEMLETLNTKQTQTINESEKKPTPKKK